MNREPYTYSLPEQFLEDSSVPARWRVWAVINGFFINGGYCWASNGWIAERIKSHKDTVSQAVKELEDKKIIRCVRGARSRNIYPMIGTNAYQWSAPTPISDRHQRLSNSVSNSVREKDTPLPSLSEHGKYDAPDPEYAPRLKTKKEPLPKTNEFVEEWNKYSNLKKMGINATPANPSAKLRVLPEARSTPDVVKATIGIRQKYSFAEYQYAVKQYAQEVINRKKSKDSDFHEHRWTLYQFLTRNNVLPNYVNR